MRYLQLPLLCLLALLPACAPAAAATTPPLRYLASKEALFATIQEAVPHTLIRIPPHEGVFKLVTDNPEAGVLTYIYDRADIHGPARSSPLGEPAGPVTLRQTATFQLFPNRDGTVSVVASAHTTSRVGGPLMAERLVEKVLLELDRQHQRLR